MGTNFYFLFKDKQKKYEWFDFDDYEITDNPDFGYIVHLAKTSYGWKPLFHGYKRMNSVSLIKKVYEDIPDCKIIDEYNDEYDWNEFKKRVLDFNKDCVATGDMSEVKEGIVMSHLLIKNESMSGWCWQDEEGYEFTNEYFR